jgi:hypothetical protein
LILARQIALRLALDLLALVQQIGHGFDGHVQVEQQRSQRSRCARIVRLQVREMRVVNHEGAIEVVVVHVGPCQTNRILGLLRRQLRQFRELLDGLLELLVDDVDIAQPRPIEQDARQSLDELLVLFDGARILAGRDQNPAVLVANVDQIGSQAKQRLEALDHQGVVLRGRRVLGR